MKRHLRKWLLRCGIGIVPVAVAWWLVPKPSLYPDDISWSRAVFDRHGELLHLSTTSDGHYRLWTPVENLSPEWIEATLTKEDRWFHRHPGVNPVALARAAWGMATGRKHGGASTLTMQVARMRWGIDSTSIPGKLDQIGRALQLERHYHKQQILEAYFNLAPYGGNVDGAGAAALLWCGRPASEVTRREAIALSVIPQSPSTRHPGQAADAQRIAAAQARLATQLEARHGLRHDPLASSFTLIPPGPPPHEAPHFCRRLVQQSTDTQIHSTLDASLQREMENSITEHLSHTSELGITNACAILVHAPSRQVLAYAGSADYSDASIHGMVDGVRAIRSPGSAVKPFIYGLALDHGLIHPQSLLSDSPLRFADYHPENFERQFLGPLHADEALARSRNIPAIELTRRLPDGGLYQFLTRSGVALDHPPGHYGLALSLGGFGITPGQLASLYAALADDGLPRPLAVTTVAGKPAPLQPSPLLTPEARFLVLEMLRRSADLDLDGGYSRHAPDVAYKTGTSHGFRDAWAAGICGDHVIVVWLGNFNGRGNNALLARNCAVPLLFKLFNRLQIPGKPATPPPGIRRVMLCALSGDLSGPCCNQASRGWFIPGVSPISTCSIHREILVDGETGLRVAQDDGRPRLTREIHEFWPPDMLELFRMAGLPRRLPPALEDGSDTLAGIDHGRAPQITDPVSGLTYQVEPMAASTEIHLKAVAAPGVRQLYWFAGSAFLGSCAPEAGLAWHAPPGSHQLRVLDDHGRDATATLRVDR